MTAKRLIVLLFGPVVLVGGLYRLTMSEGARFGRVSNVERNSFRVEGKGSNGARSVSGDAEWSAVSRPKQPPDAGLLSACRHVATVVARRLDASCQVIVRPPYVLGGNLSSDDLEAHYRETILPTARALDRAFFEHPPDEPVTILLFDDDRSFRRHALRLDGTLRACYSGYYQRSQRRIVLDISRGNGTLAHELVHALAHFDFPRMPEWFDEGLAALFEQAEFSDDGTRLEGLPNWRMHYLARGLQTGTLPSIETLVADERLRPGSEAVDYALARYFCLYLQRRHVLCTFYRRFRDSTDTDPSGRRTLQSLLKVDDLSEIDRDFGAWLRHQYRLRVEG